MHKYKLTRNDDRTYSLENSPIHIGRLGLMANRHVIDLTALPDDFTSFMLSSSIAISKTTKKHVVHAAKAPYFIVEKRNKPAMLCVTHPLPKGSGLYKPRVTRHQLWRDAKEDS